MKKKSQVVNLLDELRSQDPKKRLSSVQSVKQIAAAIGPARCRTQFIQYLAEFIDDEQHIVLELMNQLQDFATVLGGQEHQKCLLPLLIGFCKTDEKKQAQKATSIMLKILPKTKQLIVQVVKKLNKSDMNTSKQAAATIISTLAHLVPQNQPQLLQIYAGLATSENPTYKIIAAKNLDKLLQSVKNKEQVGKFLQIIYNDSEDLTKIYALNALVNYYPVNNNVPLGKFKALFAANGWRLNIKICQIVPLASKVFSKAHFKSTFEHPLLKSVSASEPELRCKSCLVLKYLAMIMSQEQLKTKLIPSLKKLSQDPVDYVKTQMSKNIVGLLEVCNQSLINDQILPIIFVFIKSNQLAIGIVKDFQAMTKKVSSDVIEQKILNPLVTQLGTDNWRVKCRLIELLENVVNSPIFLNEKLTLMLVNLLTDKINSVRQKATDLIVSIILQQSAQWCDNMIIPKLKKIRQSQSYIQRQIMLIIIDKTAEKVSQKTLNQIYKPTIFANLSDKVSNVRARALKILKGNKRLADRSAQKIIDKLKTDSDLEVRELAIMVKV